MSKLLFFSINFKFSTEITSNIIEEAIIKELEDALSLQENDTNASFDLANFVSDDARPIQELDHLEEMRWDDQPRDKPEVLPQQIDQNEDATVSF